MEMKGFIILMFILLSSTSISSSHEEWYPVYCGGMKLASPFYVAGKKHCGLPGFQVSCQHNSTLLNLSGDTYIIKTISYKYKTLRIVNSAFSHPTFDCSNISSVHNFSLHNSNLEYNTIEPSEIFLLEDCSIQALKDFNVEKIFCNKSSTTNSYWDWEEVAAECRLVVSVPYEDSGATNLEDKIKAGITLKWSIGKTGKKSGTSGFIIGKIVKGILWIVFYAIVFCIIASLLFYGGIVESGMKCLTCETQTARDNRNLELFCRYQESMAPKRYTYIEIKIMTNFLREKLGEGGYSVVYKGKLICGRLVAVKLLKQSNGDGQDFMNEVASVSRANHVNVVSLIGFCFEGRKRCLVYEFMPNGSLDKYRRSRTDNNNQKLTLETWFKISPGVARGLEYLHRGCNTRILHFDIKPHNILLGENFCPKISDFGLAKLCPQTERTKVFLSEARGTVGYIAPEVFCRNYGEVSHKSDVCSYGMLVLEVIGCRENTNTNANGNTSSSEYFPQWVYKHLNRDQEHEVGMDQEERSMRRKMILVSLWCIQTFPSNRPSMDKVVQMLEGRLDSIEVPPAPTLTSPPRSPVDPSGSYTYTIGSFSEKTSEP